MCTVINFADCVFLLNNEVSFDVNYQTVFNEVVVLFLVCEFIIYR